MSTSPEFTPVEYAPVLEVLGVPDGPDIHLCRSARTDGLEVFLMVDGNIAFLEPYQWWTRDIKFQSDAERNLADRMRQNEANTSMQYRVREGLAGQGGPMIGTITVYDHDPSSHAAKVGYWLTENAAGQGIGTRATRRVLQEARDVLGIRHIEAQIAVGNVASERLAARLGLRIKGVPWETDVVPAGRTTRAQSFIVSSWAKEL